VDFVRAVDYLIAHDEMEGVVNVTAPSPLPNRYFMRGLREAWGIRVAMPAPPWMLRLGTFLLRTETELLLKSRRVIPGRLLEHGFLFQYPDWPEAARDLVMRRGKSNEDADWSEWIRSGLEEIHERTN
jgi:NAD dependent epimerase/dehydratase family enzyme